MIIDILFLVFVAIAIFKGFQKGLIVAVFSIAGLIIGLAAALKLSTFVAAWIGQSTNISARWLPLIAFIVVFFVVVLLVRWGAALVEKAVELAFLGWANKIGGIIIYLLLYTILFSVFLFFAKQVNIFSAPAIAESKTYAYIEPWGPVVMDGIGKVIPVFKNLFTELQDFFGNLPAKVNPQ
jgi:membrane protein required for colicin V production